MHRLAEAENQYVTLIMISKYRVHLFQDLVDVDGVGFLAHFPHCLSTCFWSHCVDEFELKTSPHMSLQVILISGLIPNLPEDIERKCLRDGIKPDIVDVIPDFEIEVMFGDGVLVEFGNEINERECQEEPNVLWPFEKNTTHYTLIMTDPDYPTRSNASQREFQHWLIGNIPGTVEGNGEELTPWYPPHPIKFGGFHRYTFIVFMQPEGEKIKFDEPKLNDSVHGRAHFNTKKFAAKYNLGDPVAINYFRAESFYG